MTTPPAAPTPSGSTSKPPLLTVRDLTKDYVLGRGRKKSVQRAVDHVTFDIAPGEILGLVGESGSGKSTTARCILGLIEPTEGEVRFDGRDLRSARGDAARRLRSKVQMVFQDPYSSLDPRMRIEDIVAEGMAIHGTHRADRRERVAELLETVGLSQEHMRRRPAQFSGGQRQRIGIARALALDPELLVCDEPVASLDVSIQAQILNLFKRLQRELNLTILFIAHDLATVRFLCDRVAVMHNGAIQEIGGIEQIYDHPQSSYTRELLGAVPVPDPRVQRARTAARRARYGSERQDGPPVREPEPTTPPEVSLR
jgi:oligopeptide transport system ATP-binding protein